MSGTLKATARSPYYLRSREQKIPTDFAQGLALGGAATARGATRRPLQRVQPKKDENEDNNISIVAMDSLDSRVCCGRGDGIAEPSSPASSACAMDLEQSTPPAPVAPAQLLTQEMEISIEESRLAGAPSGPIYNLPVPERAELLAVAEGTAEELLASALAMAQTAGEDEWAKRHDAIICFRRLADDAGSRGLIAETLAECLAWLADAIRSERSAIARNGLLCATEFFEHFGASESATDAWGAHIANIVETLLHRSAGGPKFVGNAANAALTAAVKHVDAASLCVVLRNGLSDRNPDVAGNAALHIEGCLARLGVQSKGSRAGAGEGEGEGESKQRESEVPGWWTALEGAGYRVEDLTRDMAQHCHARSAIGRLHSRRSLQRLRAALGLERFTSLLHSSLPSGAQVQTVLKSTASKRKAGVMSGSRQPASQLVAKGTRISLKDRILAAQRTAQGSTDGAAADALRTPVVDRAPAERLPSGVTRIDRQGAHGFTQEAAHR